VTTFCRIYDLDSHQLSIANGHATESFVLNDTCDVWLESYKVVDLNEGRFGRQVLFDGEHALLGPGTYNLTVAVPDCAHQLDFAVGSNRVIIDTVFRPDLTLCAETPPTVPATTVPPTTVPPTTTSSTTILSTTSILPTTSIRLDVNNEERVPPTNAGPVVLGNVVYPAGGGPVVGARAPQGSLPATGAMVDALAVVGVLSVVLGARLRRRASARRAGT
jgi:hypothetical protein